MLKLAWILGRSFARQERAKLALTLFGMSLGVAVYLAIRLASDSAVESFSSTAAQVVAAESIILRSPSGKLSESIIEVVDKVAGVAKVYPYDQRFIYAAANQKQLGLFQIIGVDVLGSYPGITLAEATATTSGEPNRQLLTDLLSETPRAISVSSLDGQTKLSLVTDTTPLEVVVIAELSGTRASAMFGGKTLLLDISRFQDLFSSQGQLERLIVVPDDNKRMEVVESLRKLLPPTVMVENPGAEARHGEKLTQAFRLNLQFLAGMSLLVGVLLIYNTVSFLVLKHQRELATLRCIGSSRRELVIISAIWSLALGILASLLALPLGLYLATFCLEAMTGTISAIYLPVAASAIALSPEQILEALLIGPVIALIGCALPSLQLYSTAPRENLGRQNYNLSFGNIAPRIALVGVVCLCTSAFFSQRSIMALDIRLGFFGPLLLSVGGCLLIPLAMTKCNSAITKILGKKYPAEILLAVDHIQIALGRHSVAVAAMTLALSMLIGLTVMIGSFRSTVQSWIAHVTPADIYISSAYGPSGAKQGYLPDGLKEFVASQKNVTDIDWVTSQEIIYRDTPILVVGTRLEIAQERARLLLKYPQSKGLSKNSLIVSETFANRFTVTQGQQITLPTKYGDKEFEVENIFYDYSSDQGVIYLDYQNFANLYGETRIQGLSVYFDPATLESESPGGNSIQATIDNIRNQYSEHWISIQKNSELRSSVMTVFDNTFQITYALQLISLFVSAVTVLNTILMLIIDRAREFGVLRAIGASRIAIIRMVCAESALLGCYSLIFSTVLGLSLAMMLVFVVNKFFFAWSISFSISPEIFITTTVAVLILSILAGLLPAISFTKRISSRVLRYE